MDGYGQESGNALPIMKGDQGSICPPHQQGFAVCDWPSPNMENDKPNFEVSLIDQLWIDEALRIQIKKLSICQSGA